MICYSKPLPNINTSLCTKKTDTWTVSVHLPIIPALRRKSGFPFMGYRFRSVTGKATVAYWLAAHSLPGTSFPPLYASLTLKNTGIPNPVLVDVVSGDIRPLQWKEGTTNTVDGLPIKDSILAITDADYFDWPVLPEAPSSLSVTTEASSAKLTWENHDGNPTKIILERLVEESGARAMWQHHAEVGPSVTHFIDTSLKKGQRLAYRVSAANSDGKSAYSNIVRITAANGLK